MAQGLKATTVSVKESAVTARPSSRHPTAQGWSSGDSAGCDRQRDTAEVGSSRPPGPQSLRPRPGRDIAITDPHPKPQSGPWELGAKCSPCIALQRGVGEGAKPELQPASRQKLKGSPDSWLPKKRQMTGPRARPT